ncbi:MAG: PEP-CTERM sorting domain-containing protein [Bryobacteraceae bacterium]
MKRYEIVAPVVALFAYAAYGAPITVSEPPDFPDSGGPTYVLDVGTNTISGHVNGCAACGGTDFKDNFSVTVPAGVEITSAFFAATNFTNGGGLNPKLGVFSYAGGFGTNFGSGMPLFGQGTYSFTATSPESISALSEVPLAGAFDYTLTFDVQASETPEPSSAALALGGLLAAYWRSRRVRSDSHSANSNT